MNWFPVGKEGANKTYSSKSDCESAEGQACYDITGKDLRYHTLQEVQVGEDENQQPIMETQLLEDADLKASVIAADAAKATYEAALDARMSRQTKCLRVIALIGHLNEQKNLTQEQVITFVQTYKDIQLMLLGLSLPTARAMIAAVTPDGVITTQADIDALLAEIDAQ